MYIYIYNFHNDVFPKWRILQRHRLPIQTLLITSCSFWGWKLSQSTSNALFMESSWWELSVRVQKGGFMVDFFLR